MPRPHRLSRSARSLFAGAALAVVLLVLSSSAARTQARSGDQFAATAPTASVTPASRPVRAEEHAVETLNVRDRVADTYRRIGFAVVHAVPATGFL